MNQKGFESIATDMGVPLEDAKLDPVSNAILLTPSAHTLYHYRLISIDPDNDYAVTDFTKPGEFHGCRMYQAREVSHRERPLDVLLRYHYQQAVLRNVRGGDDDDDKLASVTSDVEK